MPKEKGKHLDFDDRCEIEEMLKDGASFQAHGQKAQRLDNYDIQ